MEHERLLLDTFLPVRFELLKYRLLKRNREI